VARATQADAQRVLTRVSFVCQRADEDDEGHRGWVVQQPAEDDAESEDSDARIRRLEAALSVAQEAIAPLVGRVKKLESSTR
jgi:hypothetical protein